jgi:hypothetical protein
MHRLNWETEVLSNWVQNNQAAIESLAEFAESAIRETIPEVVQNSLGYKEWWTRASGKTADKFRDYCEKAWLPNLDKLSLESDFLVNCVANVDWFGIGSDAVEDVWDEVSESVLDDIAALASQKLLVESSFQTQGDLREFRFATDSESGNLFARDWPHAREVLRSMFSDAMLADGVWGVVKNDDGGEFWVGYENRYVGGAE